MPYLRHLFSGTGTDVAEEDAIEMLAQLFADDANDPDFELGGIDLTRTASVGRKVRTIAWPSP